MNNVFEIDNGILIKYHGEDDEVIVPDGVIKIGSEAFENNVNLRSIDLSESVVSIGRFAFFGCKSLVSVNLPNSLKTIEEKAFRDCTNLFDITLPNDITNIESDMLDFCDNLEEITIYGEVFTLEDIIDEYDWSEIAEDYDIDEDEICNLTIAVHNTLVEDLLKLLINGDFDKLYMPEDLRYEIIANVLKHKPANINFLKMAKEHITELTPYLTENPEVIQYINENI